MTRRRFLLACLPDRMEARSTSTAPPSPQQHFKKKKRNEKRNKKEKKRDQSYLLVAPQRDLVQAGQLDVWWRRIRASYSSRCSCDSRWRKVSGGSSGAYGALERRRWLSDISRGAFSFKVAPLWEPRSHLLKRPTRPSRRSNEASSINPRGRSFPGCVRRTAGYPPGFHCRSKVPLGTGRRGLDRFYY